MSCTQCFERFFKKKIDFFTFHPKVFAKLLLTQNYLCFFNFNPKLFIFYYLFASPSPILL
ncbi:hypothetical protein HanXRQr2_Chr05g0223631 [Helianthus annuus]|uniref:Uncharacterized protein n=1 Tax=Helianthus annuus TaxID=4232 RepID=A0A9K3J1J2_HELAN|nr:hypothetical protein HanXRQr2_Chr05g0223631 [Helianthus annuus]KAJ0923438.1 hypothetical protein HanPSC8_Chr05g0215891 [Helianthus annuus]